MRLILIKKLSSVLKKNFVKLSCIEELPKIKEICLFVKGKTLISAHFASDLLVKVLLHSASSKRCQPLIVFLFTLFAFWLVCSLGVVMSRRRLIVLLFSWAHTTHLLTPSVSLTPVITLRVGQIKAPPIIKILSAAESVLPALLLAESIMWQKTYKSWPKIGRVLISEGHGG